MSKATATATPTPTPTPAPAPAPAATVQEPPTITLPEPKPGFHYVQVPEDVRLSAITSSFIASLCRIGGGDLVAELDDDMRALVAASMSLGKKGKLALALTVKPDSYKKLAIKPEVKATIPRVQTENAILFATPEGQLLPHDPEQMTLPLHQGPVRRVEPPPPPTNIRSFTTPAS